MDTGKIKVLLIGKVSDTYSPLSYFLKSRGCGLRFAISKREVCWLLEARSFDLVLAPIRLDGNSLYPLIRWLHGSTSTLFYSQPVEDGCWWLPALWRGKKCFGAPALRPSAFATVLDEFIQIFQSTSLKQEETRLAIAPCLSDAIINHPFSSVGASLPVLPAHVKSSNYPAYKALG
jgi:hypothetical protein